MARAFIILLDSLGIGATKDAGTDAGANTLAHIAHYCADNNNQLLHIPNLIKLGLHDAALLLSGQPLSGLGATDQVLGMYGAAAPLGCGKDTTSGHWELAGVPITEPWGYYHEFPQQLLAAIISRAGIPGLLGNKAASGTEIINELGQEHQRTGQPIIYTSADSVLQLAAHEHTYSVEQLYNLCAIARELADDYNIARVIARPFVGEPNHYIRTAGRRDYSTPPPEPTLLERLVAAGKTVTAIGKVADIYAHQGISNTITADGNKALFATLLTATADAGADSLTFVNLVDFDTKYGHRRDVVGYARALEDFDALLPSFMNLLRPGDLAIITADHGCDPTWHGSDHTREHIPVLAFGPGFPARSLGVRTTFADIGQTIAAHLGIAPLDYGASFL